MGARMLHGEFVVVTRQAGPTRRDPRMEIGWQTPERSEPVARTGRRHAEEVSPVAAAETALVLPNE